MALEEPGFLRRAWVRGGFGDTTKTRGTYANFSLVFARARSSVVRNLLSGLGSLVLMQVFVTHASEPIKVSEL